MKYLVVALLIMSFVGIGVFGHMLFDMGPGHSGNCIVSVIDGTDCPTNIVGFVRHHISAAQTFTTMVIPITSNWFLLLASLLFIGLVFLSPFLFSPPQLSLYRYRLRNFFISLQKQQLTRWLALHENSPAIP